MPPSEQPEPLPACTITVATVTYNAGALIDATIHSVEMQTYPHVEHLIVDGNSHDDTLERIHHYQERNSIAPVPHDIQCISEPDHGLYDAMNKALDMAHGDYIVFLNAGDRLHSPQVLQQVFGHMDTTAPLPAIVYGETDLIDGQGHFLRHRRLKAPARLTWRSFCHGMLVCHQAFFAKRTLAPTYDTSYRFSADFDWCIRVMKQSKQLSIAMLTIVLESCL